LQHAHPSPSHPSNIVLRHKPHAPHPNSNCKPTQKEKPTQTPTQTWDGELSAAPILAKRKKYNTNKGFLAEKQ
jgi:hypothetical protein